jgi:hypothetical protein
MPWWRYVHRGRVPNVSSRSDGRSDRCLGARQHAIRLVYPRRCAVRRAEAARHWGPYGRELSRLPALYAASAPPPRRSQSLYIRRQCRHCRRGSASHAHRFRTVSNSGTPHARLARLRHASGTLVARHAERTPMLRASPLRPASLPASECALWPPTGRRWEPAGDRSTTTTRPPRGWRQWLGSRCGWLGTPVITPTVRAFTVRPAPSSAGCWRSPRRGEHRAPARSWMARLWFATWQ